MHLSVAGLFKYVWPFSVHPPLKCQMYENLDVSHIQRSIEVSTYLQLKYLHIQCNLVLRQPGSHVSGHQLSTDAKFSEKLTFLTPSYARPHVHIRVLEMLLFRKILPTYLMDDLIWACHSRINNIKKRFHARIFRPWWWSIA